MSIYDDRVRELEERIAELPAGYISRKIINGSVKKYYQWTEDGKKKTGRGRRNNMPETITSEVIYAWMCFNNIPSEYEKWHIKRLLTLIQVCNTYNQPPKKMSKNDIIRNNDAINAARRAAMKTRG
jgi:hypothetical protein